MRVLALLLVAVAVSGGCTLFPPSRPFLLVTEGARAEPPTSDLFADMGPHCARVAYSRDPAEVTIWQPDGSGGGGAGEAVIVRDWRQGMRFLTTGSELDVLRVLEGRAILASPFDGGVPVVVELHDGTFQVNGTTLVPMVPYTVNITEQHDAVRVARVLTFEDLGEAKVRVKRAIGGCD